MEREGLAIAWPVDRSGLRMRDPPAQGHGHRETVTKRVRGIARLISRFMYGAKFA